MAAAKQTYMEVSKCDVTVQWVYTQNCTHYQKSGGDQSDCSTQLGAYLHSYKSHYQHLDHGHSHGTVYIGVSAP